MPPISEDDLRGLSAAERDALLELDEGDEDVVAALGTGAAAAPAPAPAATEDDADDETASPPAAAPAPAPAAAAPAAAPAVEQPADAAAAPSPAPAPAPADDDESDLTPQRVTPDDIEDQRKTLRTERAEALQKMLDGEMSREDFQAVDERVSNGLDKLVRAEATDAARQQIQLDGMMADYSKELRSARGELKAAGLDPATVSADFDRAVRMFAQDAQERGLEDKPGDLAASKDALAEAVAYTLRLHGKAAAAAPAPAPAPAPAAAAPAPTAPQPARVPKPVDRSTLPPTLAGVPVAADASITSEFGHLTGLEGSALERALARLTPEQQDRYLDAV